MLNKCLLLWPASSLTLNSVYFPCGWISVWRFLNLSNEQSHFILIIKVIHVHCRKWTYYFIKSWRLSQNAKKNTEKKIKNSIIPGVSLCFDIYFSRLFSRQCSRYIYIIKMEIILYIILQYFFTNFPYKYSYIISINKTWLYSHIII